MNPLCTRHVYKMPVGLRAYEGTADMRALRRSRDGLRADWATRMGRICGTVAIAAVIGVAELASAPASMSATSATSATSGLVAAYGFDEGSGTTVTDASGNGNTGTITGATWAAAGKYGKALQLNGTNALVTIPNAASLQLSAGMTLEAWVNPSTVNANWRDVIYKANDNYYLEATSTNASKPDAGMIAGGSYADALGNGQAHGQHLVVPDRDLRRLDAEAVRQRHSGRLDGAHGSDREFHEPAADRWRQPLRPVLRRHDRRGPCLQRRAERRPDPDRHGDAGEQRSGHDPADAGRGR